MDLPQRIAENEFRISEIMPRASLSSIIFVGDGFSVGMFDERIMFGGNLDRDTQSRLGTYGRFTYLSNSYEFEVAPQRIDLRYAGTEIIPEALISAAHTVAGILQPAIGAVAVTAIGINFDTSIERARIGLSGIEFCSLLANPPLIADILGESPVELSVRTWLRSPQLVLDIRFEPYFSSKGEDLFVAINGHQSVNQGESLSSKLDAAQRIREEIQALEQRIVGFSRS